MIQNGHRADEVDTAGHCVANTDGHHKFSENIIFIPAYNGNEVLKGKREPFGAWVANGLYVANAWLNNGDVSGDYGSLLLAHNKKLQEIDSVTGYDGWEYGSSLDQQFVQFGYPAESPFNGAEMWENIAASAVTLNVGGVGPELLGVGSPFTGGSSGGAWNVRFEEGITPGRINGHTDYYLFKEPETKYSPYYDALWHNIHCIGNEAEC